MKQNSGVAVVTIITYLGSNRLDYYTGHFYWLSTFCLFFLTNVIAFFFLSSVVCVQ